MSVNIRSIKDYVQCPEWDTGPLKWVSLKVPKSQTWVKDIVFKYYLVINVLKG